MTNIHSLIAAIRPDPFCEKSVRSEVKEIVKEELAKGNPKAYLEAAKIAKPTKSEILVYDKDAARKKPLAKFGYKIPIANHKIEYDSTGEGLEPIYFWLVDFMGRVGYEKIEKVIDNFASSPGSGHFGEMGMKATRVQEEAMKMLGAVNQVIKSILNLVYDLKEMKLLLKNYEDAHSPDSEMKKAARLSLKQRWMDN